MMEREQIKNDMVLYYEYLVRFETNQLETGVKFMQKFPDGAVEPTELNRLKQEKKLRK